jgi:triosephosphate isomerase
MSRMPLVAGNWKMHKTVAEGLALVDAMLDELQAVSGVERVLCPPFTLLAPLRERLKGSPIGLGAQNLYWEAQGAFTAEVSPAMVAELCEYVILGHSERRAYFEETDGTVNLRLKAALGAGLKPVLCVGETLTQNEAGKTAEVVSRQVRLALDGINSQQAADLIVAYEPVWAIGTGKAATVKGANAVIRDVVRPALQASLDQDRAQSVRVLYGGSVKPENAAEFFAASDIDGALVGGASLKARDFVAIVAAAA